MIRDSVVNQNGWIGITVVLFVAGIGIGYGVFSSSQVMPSIMMDNTMNSGMMMGSSPIEQHERMLELVEMMGDDEDMMNHLFAHMIENERMIHQMFSLMDSNSALKEHMEAHVSGDLSEYEHLDDIHDEEEHGHEDEHQ